MVKIFAFLLKLLILICALLLHTNDVKENLQEEFYNKNLVASKLDRESKLLYSNCSLI